MEKNEINKAAISFQKYRSKLKELYGGEKSVANRLGTKWTGSNIEKATSGDINEQIKDAMKETQKLPGLSRAAVMLSNPYASIVNYYKTFFYIRYTVTPQKIKSEEESNEKANPPGSKIRQDQEEYGKIYYRMMDSVEGLNLENTLPTIASKALIDGRCAIITTKDTSSDTVIFTYLPIEYVKSIGVSQYGTNIIAFNFEYFDQLKNQSSGSSSEAVEDTTFDTILASMPKILQEGYKRYLKDKNHAKWQSLDPKIATEFAFNEAGIPPRIGAYGASADYADYKDIELSRSANQLNKILVTQIPTNSDGELIMNASEAIEVANEMRDSLSDIPDVKVVTAFGKTDLFDLQKTQQESSAALNTAYENIFSSAGVDYHVFISDKDLEASIKRDKAFMWDFYIPVMNFINVTFNNLLNFKPYQAKISLLPISMQMETEDVHRFIEYAGAGIGRLQAVVATGIKQRDLKSNYDIETFLDLDNILKPLQSMYTSSYRVNERNKKAKDEEKDTEQDNSNEPTVQKEEDDDDSKQIESNEE